MARNNFTPIPYGAVATSNAVNAPMEQLSDAIDNNATRITALENTSGKLPVFCRCESASVASKLCKVDTTSYAAVEQVSSGDIFYIACKTACNINTTEIRIQVDGTIVKRATAKNVPTIIAAGSVFAVVYDGTFFQYAGYIFDAAYLS